MATFWERAAHLVNYIFSLYYDYISLFGFEDETLVLISIPGHCYNLLLFTIKRVYIIWCGSKMHGKKQQNRHNRYLNSFFSHQRNKGKLQIFQWED